MKLGAFSLSLSVKDLQASKAFYQKLGFSVYAGNEEHQYLIMKNGETLIGLFHGMFENNMMTFNPGWDQSANSLEQYDDIREIHQSLKAQGIDSEHESIEQPSGPANFAIKDPDGNVILFDQHV